MNNGGTISPGESPGQTHVVGDLTINSGTVRIELASATEFDTLLVDDLASLGGNLSVSLLDFFSPSPLDVFEIITAGTLSNTFDNAPSTVTAVGAGTFDITYTSTSVLLSNFVAAPGLLGDYNNNGTIDAADYTVWRDAKTSGDILANDPNGNGIADEEDFAYWREHFGESLGGGSGQGLASVPEPASLVLVVMGWLLMVGYRRTTVR